MDEKPFRKIIRQRRHELDLTQEELARRVGCAAITIRKIEAEAARPSEQIAERLAMALAIPLAERAEFVRQARSIHPDALEPSIPPLTPSEVGAEDLTGRTIRGYALGEKIGSGGMGVVYHAVQPVFEREVAIKIILPQYANHPEFIRRFETEAQLVARLEHPHIVPLYDYWREPGAAYLVMRLLRGGNLGDLINEGPLSLQTVTHIMEQIGTALLSAHRFGVIHRDLKPANILLDEDQNAYLADFGIAKYLSNSDVREQKEMSLILEAVKYITPEQIQSVSLNPQSDIYCLGVILYEMLTGKLPYMGPTPIDYIHQHFSAPMPALSANRRGLPATLDKVIGRATAKGFDERYTDVSEFLMNFHQALGDRVVIQPIFPSEEIIVSDRELTNPYKGLRAFLEADAEDFFGREVLIQQLLDRMGEGGDLFRFLSIIGPSGSGKSSVVSAGVIPALRQGALVGSENWFYVNFAPGKNPFEELNAALLSVAVNPPLSKADGLGQGELSLMSAVNYILPDDPSVELVVVIDQFEELFTLVENDDIRSQFLNDIVSIVLDERSRIRIILTLRADFIGQVLRYIDFGELIQQRNELVLPLTPDELERAIVKPAQRVGLTFETGLVASILGELGVQPGNLPLLQFALTELYEKREGRKLTKAAYDEVGGVSGSLIRRAEKIYGSLISEQQAIARQLFLRLVNIGEGVEETSRKVLQSELEYLHGVLDSSAKVDDVIDVFYKSRLLTFDHDPITREPTVVVAHEALLREWSRLSEWLEESRNYLYLQRQLSNAANDWQESGLDEGFFLTGAKLSQYDDWEHVSDVALTKPEEEFLQASREFHEKDLALRKEQQEREVKLQHRVKRILQALVIVFLIAALVSGGLAIWVNIQRQTARKQAATLLAEQAETELSNGYHDRAVLLALAALENYPYTPQAEHALGQAVSYNRAIGIYDDHTSAVTSVAWSPDGDLVASSSSSNEVHIWDPESGENIMVIKMPTGITGNKLDMALNVQWTRDGENLLVIAGDRYLLGSQDYDVLFYDALSGDLISSVEIENQAESESGDLSTSFINFPTGMAADFGNETGRLVTLGGDNTAIIWDKGWESMELVLSGHSRGVNSVAWSPDENSVVSASLDGTARIWDAKTGETLHVLEGHEGRVNIALWSPNGAEVATAGEDGTLRIWDSQTGDIVRVIESNEGSITSLVWSPVGKRMITGHEDGSIRIWNIETGELLETLRGHPSDITDLKWSVIDDRLLSSDESGSVRIWNAGYSTAWRLYPPQEEQEVPWTVQGASWSSDGRSLVMAGGDVIGFTDPASFLVWDVYENQLTNENLVEQLDFMGYEAHFSPNNESILYLGFAGFPDFSGLATAYLFDVKSGEIIQSFTPDGVTPISGSSWSRDGSMVATGLFNNHFVIWDAQTGQKLKELVYSDNDAMTIHWVQWSPDGLRFSVASDESSARIYDAQTWEPLFTLQHQEPAYLNFASWSPDGTRLLTGGGNDEAGAKDNTARIWDSTTGEELFVFTNHTKSVWPGDWSPDGSRIVTGSSDGTVRIWDSETGDELLTLSVPVTYAMFVWWSPDGSHIAIAGLDTLVSVWNVWQSSDELIDYAKDCCIIRDLTQEEQLLYGLP